MGTWIAFFLLSAFWGSSYLFIRVAVEDMSPITLVALRLIVGACTIGLIGLVRRQTLRLPRQTIAILVGIATINTTAPFLLISWGEVSVPSGLASVLNSTVPIFTVMIAGFVLIDERVTVYKLSGVALGFGGILVLLSRNLVPSNTSLDSVVGQAAILLSSVCYACGAILTRRLLRGVAPMTIAVYAVSFAAIETTVLSLIFSPPWTAHYRPASVLAFVWLGMLGTGFAYALSYAILSKWGASRYTLIAYMLPITGLTLGAVILKEKLDWHILAGTVLVLAGVVIASRTRQPKPVPKPVPT